MTCIRLYQEIYHRDPDNLSFCPYRISPLGAHIDHQLGRINGLAIDKGVYIAFSPKHNGVIELQSINFPGKRAQFHVASIPEEKQNDWADHCRGAALVFSRTYTLTVGLSAVIEGTLPIGGLSSSAAVIIVFLTALASVNNIRLEPWETIMMAKAAENEYVGVNCGKLDQSCEVLCRKDSLLYLDCSDDSYTLIPWTGPKFSIAVFFSWQPAHITSDRMSAKQQPITSLPLPVSPMGNSGTRCCGMFRAKSSNSMLPASRRTFGNVPRTSLERSNGRKTVQKHGNGETLRLTGNWYLSRDTAALTTTNAAVRN